MPNAPAVPGYANYENFSLEDQKAFNGGIHVTFADAVYILDSVPKSKFLMNLAQVYFSAKMCPLSNPGGMLYVVTERNRKPLTQKDRVLLADIARKAGVDVLENGRIPFRFGPDHITPIVMHSIITYAPEESAKVVHMSVDLQFKSTATAKEAVLYTDAKTYTAKVIGTKLHISFDSPKGAYDDDRESFDRIAKKFDGKVDSLGYEDDDIDPIKFPVR